MYIRLGNTKINYVTAEYDDFMIFAEVPDIYMSYEKPILIHTKDELDIWFGKNFKERNYFDELLLSGVTLFLYKPISKEPNEWQKDYIDFSIYNNVEHLYYTESDFSFTGSTIGEYSFSSLPEVGSPEIIYKVIRESGKYDVGLSALKYDKLIWLSDQENYVNVDDLSQNTGVNSASSLNRDTLRLCKVGTDVSYCHPAFGHEYAKRDYTEYYIYNNSKWVLMGSIPNGYNYTASSLGELKSIVVNPTSGDIAKINYSQSNKIINTEGINLDKIKDGYQTYAYSFNLKGTTLVEGDYIILKDYLGNYVMIKHGDTGSVDPKYYNKSVEVSTSDDLIEEIQKLGYSLTVDSETQETLIVSDFPSPVTYFYKMSILDLKPSFDKTQDILTDYTENTSRIEFWSKTIGTDGPESDITISIEKLDTDNYRISISRYDYSEIYEGYIFETGEERLDYVISKNSKLVYCKLNNYWTNSDGEKIKYVVEENELPEGSWVLARSWKESYTTDSYRTSLDKLFDSTIIFDFFLMPNIGNYDNTIYQESYYKIYKDLGDLAETKDCQILIENNSTNYTYNYIGDTYNRLVYFYNSMYIGNGYYRPGYYMFLQGLLGDIYSITTDNIVYDTPMDATQVDTYNDKPDLIKKLEEKKSNYLIDNGLEYYYKTYLDGTKPENTGLQRFVLSKISRELEKNKWNYLGEKMSGKIQNNIQKILDRVVDNFSIIRSITIVYMDLDYYDNKVTLSLDTKMSDLIKNDISLDITINFNRELWQQ
jgi:hypothetical protein